MTSFSKDLAFYYEMHPGRLGLAGTIRRISYEHNLTWSDRVVRACSTSPPMCCMWRGPKGSLDYWAIAMSRGTIATLLQQAATIAASDAQLSRAGEIDVDGARVPVYTLSLASDRTLLLASYRDRVVVLSDAGMLKGSSESGDARDAVGRLLSADVKQHPFLTRRFRQARIPVVTAMRPATAMRPSTAWRRACILRRLAISGFFRASRR